MMPESVNPIAQPDRFEKKHAPGQIRQKQRILQLQLQPQRVTQQAIQQRVWFGSREIFAQAFRLQTQTGQSSLRIVGKRRKKSFHLRMTLLLAPRVVEQRQPAADQRRDQNAAFPQKHLVMTMQGNRTLEIQTIE